MRLQMKFLLKMQIMPSEGEIIFSLTDSIVNLEKIIEMLIIDFCKEYNLLITNDKILKRNNLPKELDLVKRAILVDFGNYSLLPDGDIIIYKNTNELPEIIAILSVKNSFRAGTKLIFPAIGSIN